MKDYIVRATAAGSQVRAFAAVTRDTVETARQAHNTSPVDRPIIPALWPRPHWDGFSPQEP